MALACLVAIPALTDGCAKKDGGGAAAAPTPTPTASPAWGPAYPVDLGGLDTALLKYKSFNGADRTVGAFQLVSDRKLAVLGVSFAQSSGGPVYFRAMGRVYYSRNVWDGHWVRETGHGFSLLDSGGVDITDLSLGISPRGEALAAFWGGGETSWSSARFSATDGWGDFKTVTPAPAQAMIAGTSGFTGNGIAWDRYGTAYLGYSYGAGTQAAAWSFARVTGWSLFTSGSPSTPPTPFQMISDGYFAHALWVEGTGSLSQLPLAPAPSFPSEPGSAITTTASPKLFSAASDGEGNLVVAFLQTDPTVDVTKCKTGVLNCNVRLFMARRTAAGYWTAPGRVDDHLVSEGSTHYQKSSDLGGVDYATPGLVHLGGGIFCFIYPALDLNDANKPLAVLYARYFDLMQGWSSRIDTLDSVSLSSSEAYRPVNTLRVSSGGDGNWADNVIVVTNYVAAAAGNNLKQGRKYGVKVFLFDTKSGWSPGNELPGVPLCPATTAACNTLRATGAVFGPREAIAVFEAPAEPPPVALKVRLYSAEFR